MAFRYQAIDASGRTLTDVVEAGSQEQALDLLRQRRLFVTRLDATDAAPRHTPVASERKPTGRTGGRLSDVIFFTQQMAMLVRSGARVVQGMEAIEAQTHRASWRHVVTALRKEVEQGRPLSAALEEFPSLFSPVYINMVAAGEASGDMARSFDRLASLMRQQQEIRNRVVGALTYPAVLMCLCMGVLTVLFTFVLPRFAVMFEALDVELPTTTSIMIRASRWAGAHWYWLSSVVVACVAAGILFIRSRRGRQFLSRAAIRVPVFGVIVRNVVLAQICRIWGQLLESKVGLLEAVELTRQSTRSLDFQELLERITEAITEGRSIGPPLRDTWLLPKTFAAAIVTGEESGKLAESLIFVASCLEEENTQVLASLTRIIEPIMLVVMGVIVGTVAISLFLPMFDMATVTSR